MRIITSIVFAFILSSQAWGQTLTGSHRVSLSLDEAPASCVVSVIGSFDFGTITDGVGPWIRIGNGPSATITGDGVASVSISYTGITSLLNGSTEWGVDVMGRCRADPCPPQLPNCADPPCTDRAVLGDTRASATIYLGADLDNLPSNWITTYPGGEYTGTVSVHGTCSS